ncbi:MAG: hypothetical protein WCV82_00805 [Candidatus Paceibacterota bacterium]
MSIRHKKRRSQDVSRTQNRKVLANRARLNGHLKPGQSAAPFPLRELERMAAA